MLVNQYLERQREKSNTHHIFPNLGKIPEEPVTWKKISLSGNGLNMN